MSAGKLSASMVFKSVSLTPSFRPSKYQYASALILSSKDSKEGCSDGRGHCGCLDAVWDSAVVTSGDGWYGDGRVGAGGLRPEGGQYQCECILSLLGSTAASNVNSMRNVFLMNFYVEFRICKQQK